MSFNLKILIICTQLYNYKALESHGPFKVDYLECFVLNTELGMVIYDLSLGLPHSWQTYSEMIFKDSRIIQLGRQVARYCSRALNQHDNIAICTRYLISARRPFAWLSLNLQFYSHILCMHCLNVRCWSSSKVKSSQVKLYF